MDKVGHLRIRLFYGVIFGNETWTKCSTGGFDNFKAHHLRRKHGLSGLLEI